MQGILFILHGELTIIVEPVTFKSIFFVQSVSDGFCCMETIKLSEIGFYMLNSQQRFCLNIFRHCINISKHLDSYNF